MIDFRHRLYNTAAWRRCRAGYAASVGNLCERCLRKGLAVPGVEVHHKVRLTPQNINDPTITLAWDNLELLCEQCHIDEHSSGTKRWRVDQYGRLV